MKLDLYKSFSRLKIASLYGIGKHIATLSQLVISYVIIKKHSDILWGEYVEFFLWVNLIVLFAYFENKSFLLKSFSELPSKIHQSWVTNFNSRILLFLVSLGIILLVPLFEHYRLLISLWAFSLFYNQSFEVLILYQKDFKFSIFVESLRSIFIIGAILIFNGTLDLRLLLTLVVIAGILKAVCYSVFYLRKFTNVKMKIDLQVIVRSIPFFLPMLLGTFRSRIDTYYGTIFFTKSELSHYQIFVSILSLAQLGTAYIVNPYLKNLYRLKSMVLNKIQRQSAWIGIISAILFLPVLYFTTHYVYGFNFTIFSYAMGFTFVTTLFLHIILVTEFYKRDQQYTIAIVIAIIALFQIVLGYYTIPLYKIEGALAIKVIGQLISVGALFYIKKSRWKITS
ncbi:hypothetical protein [Spongiimicrobium salis]|uniref:hypothetical protein n=1 Tax=Spongiimicrobium salis TaxID=1667022 RepID=UPI00374CE232